MKGTTEAIYERLLMSVTLKLGGANSTWASMVWTTCAIGGATIIMLFGIFMFAASLGPARPF
jgi:nickel/cobalt transporter (NicO) family protein